MTTPPLRLLFLSFLTTVAVASTVPASQTFTYINQGEFGPYITEYDASYRTLPLFASPFQLCFYNTTPNAYYLAIRMATRRSESLFRWVWEANRGRPVHENAIFSLRPDGNLILADADGTLVWSTTTTNKNVAGVKLLSNGNMVVYDAHNRFIWQSFDHPTDTLLVGQSLHATGQNKLVSRGSAVGGGFGIYSLILSAGGLDLVMSVNKKSLVYSNIVDFTGTSMESLKLVCELDEGFSEVKLVSNNSDSILAQVKYNATLSLLRLQTDGNLVVYTYYDPVDYQAWEKTFAWFSDDIGQRSGCGLPSKCGVLGVCEDEMCVACPTKMGLKGWSRDCLPPKLGACRAPVDYYKVAGVENFLTVNAVGVVGVTVEECKKGCTADCGCKGIFYWEKEAKCWLAPVIGTLAKVSNSTHLAYIKYSK